MGCDYCGSYVPPPPCSVCNMICNAYSCTCNQLCYGHQAAIHYRVMIDSAGVVDTFKWSDDGGGTYDVTGIAITGEKQNLNNGVQIKFDKVTGHTNADYWDFYAGDGIFIGERLIYYYQQYGGANLAYHSFHPGSSTQEVDSQLKLEIPEWNECMRNTAYSYFRLDYGSDGSAWRQISDYMIVAKGKKLYDPRNGRTEYSRNPALVWLDFMTNGRYGLGVHINYIDLASVEDVANWCDSHSYYFDGVLLDRMAFGDHMEQIMLNFKVFTVWSQGVYYLKVYADDAVVMDLTEDDVDITPETFKINIPGIPETPNSAKATFADKENFYTANFATRVYPGVITYTGEQNVLEFTLIGTTGMNQAKKIAKYLLLRNIWNKEYTFNCHYRTFPLEPGDMVYVTHSFPGWTQKKLRVKSTSTPQQGMITISFYDEDTSIYDETLD